MTLVDDLEFSYIPPNNETWLFSNHEGDYVLYQNLPIDCREELPPTQKPTSLPSLSPTECPERVAVLRQTVDGLEEELSECLADRMMSCTDDDAYIIGSTNGVMDSCSSFIAWVVSIGLDCNG